MIEVVRGPRRQELPQGDRTELWMEARTIEICACELERFQLLEIASTQTRKLVEPAFNSLAGRGTNCASRSNRSKARVSPCSRMILARGIQSVCSP